VCWSAFPRIWPWHAAHSLPTPQVDVVVTLAVVVVAGGGAHWFAALVPWNTNTEYKALHSQLNRTKPNRTLPLLYSSFSSFNIQILYVFHFIFYRSDFDIHVACCWLLKFWQVEIVFDFFSSFPSFLFFFFLLVLLLFIFHSFLVCGGGSTLFILIYISFFFCFVFLGGYSTIFSLLIIAQCFCSGFLYPVAIKSSWSEHV